MHARPQSSHCFAITAWKGYQISNNLSPPPHPPKYRGTIWKASFCPLLKMDARHPDLWGLTHRIHRNPREPGSGACPSAKHLCFWPTFLAAPWLSRLTSSPRREGYVTPDQRECRCSTSQPRGDGEPSCFASIIPPGPHLWWTGGLGCYF